MTSAVALAALLFSAGPAEEARSHRSPTEVATPELAGTWQVIVRPGAYDGCGIKQEVLASQWLISQSGRDLSIRIAKSDGSDTRLEAVIDRSRVVLLSETTVQLAEVPPEDNKGWNLTSPGRREGRETWLLAIADGLLTGTRTIVVQREKPARAGDRPGRFCLVEQDVVAKRP